MYIVHPLRRLAHSASIGDTSSNRAHTSGCRPSLEFRGALHPGSDLGPRHIHSSSPEYLPPQTNPSWRLTFPGLFFSPAQLSRCASELSYYSRLRQYRRAEARASPRLQPRTFDTTRSQSSLRGNKWWEYLLHFHEPPPVRFYPVQL